MRIRHQEVESGGHIGYDISPVYRKKGYGFQILKLALKKALEIGLKEVIVTCNINNIASKKIIEKKLKVISIRLVRSHPRPLYPRGLRLY